MLSGRYEEAEQPSFRRTLEVASKAMSSGQRIQISFLAKHDSWTENVLFESARFAFQDLHHPRSRRQLSLLNHHYALPPYTLQLTEAFPLRLWLLSYLDIELAQL